MTLKKALSILSIDPIETKKVNDDTIIYYKMKNLDTLNTLKLLNVLHSTTYYYFNSVEEIKAAAGVKRLKASRINLLKCYI